MEKIVLCAGCGAEVAQFDDQSNTISYATENGSHFSVQEGQSANVKCRKCDLATRIFARNGLVFGIDPTDYKLRKNPRLGDGGALVCPKCGCKFGSFSHKAGDICPYCEMSRNAADLFSKL